MFRKALILISFLLFSFLRGFSDAPKTVLFCWSKPDHPAHTHIYPEFAIKMSEAFNASESFKALTVEGFPSKDEWEQSDLVVFYLTIKSLTDEQYKIMDRHLAKGKGLVVLHQALVHRQGYDKYADRIGMAFSWDKNFGVKSKWGKINSEIELNTDYEILKGLPNVIQYDEELYWNLLPGKKGRTTILGKMKPIKLKNDKEAHDWPVFWITEHLNKETSDGRVFVSVIGHYVETFQEKAFMRILLNGLMWSMHLDQSKTKDLLPLIKF